jgi:hypothetical protein
MYQKRDTFAIKIRFKDFSKLLIIILNIIIILLVKLNTTRLKADKGRTMAQAVSPCPLTAEARVPFWVSQCGICGGQSDTGTGFPLSISFHQCSITRKTKKKLINFITGLHNKNLGCGASVASAAGPFTTQNKSTQQKY